MPHIEKMAKIEVIDTTAFDDDPDDPTTPWALVVTYLNAGLSEEIPGFKTAGEAVDYAYKWANDRGMFIGIPAITLNAKREVK